MDGWNIFKIYERYYLILHILHTLHIIFFYTKSRIYFAVPVLLVKNGYLLQHTALKLESKENIYLNFFTLVYVGKITLKTIKLIIKNENFYTYLNKNENIIHHLIIIIITFKIVNTNLLLLLELIIQN